MKSINKISLIVGLLAMTCLFSCKKDGFLPTDDNIPEIPVTVANASAYFTSPVVTASKATGDITITLTIPASSGRTIKEITRVTANGNSYANVQKTTGLYNTAPIPGSGTSVTFKTTLTEYNTKTGRPIPAPDGTAAVSILTNFFFFMITLDNGQVIIPSYVKVYVAS